MWKYPATTAQDVIELHYQGVGMYRFPAFIFWDVMGKLITYYKQRGPLVVNKAHLPISKRFWRDAFRELEKQMQYIEYEDCRTNR